MLRKGMAGIAVVRLQRQLNAQHFKVGIGLATGYYGTATENAVRKLQGAYGINVDGVFGDESAAKLARNGQLSDHFHVNEFASHGNGDLVLNHELIVKLEKLRKSLGVPIKVVSGYRDPVYNRKIGGVQQSQHMYGKAADIQVIGWTPTQVAEKAAVVGFRGLGIYRGFTHVDVRMIPARWHG